ncbi:hypothetical protein FDP41_001827 [Naegleria fowleri]|uniref:EGF-like domain-containing protein n=1 Tax=Naegleria fowleri TaxID=5763 RepID=A0A6A5BNV1_NAEFO|nr:uncharacterized protein FDP41_001827 [Naegleria fowleri]KAF0978757.1 hypothetical protein FDP41_001827 [Naegleria fowleri]
MSGTPTNNKQSYQQQQSGDPFMKTYTNIHKRGCRIKVMNLDNMGDTIHHHQHYPQSEGWAINSSIPTQRINYNSYNFSLRSMFMASLFYCCCLLLVLSSTSILVGNVNSLPICNGRLSTDNLVCSGHGWCTEAGVCMCDPDYNGTNCEQFTCNGIAIGMYGVCSGHGQCIEPLGCKCDVGYKGLACEQSYDPNAPSSSSCITDASGKCTSSSSISQTSALGNAQADSGTSSCTSPLDVITNPLCSIPTSGATSSWSFTEDFKMYFTLNETKQVGSFSFVVDSFNPDYQLLLGSGVTLETMDKMRGNALSFSGNGGITLDKSPISYMSNNFTISFWIKFDSISIGSQQTIFSINSSDAYWSFSFNSFTALFKSQVQADSSCSIPTDVMNDSDYNHVIISKTMTTGLKILVGRSNTTTQYFTCINEPTFASDLNNPQRVEGNSAIGFNANSRSEFFADTQRTNHCAIMVIV